MPYVFTFPDNEISVRQICDPLSSGRATGTRPCYANRARTPSLSKIQPPSTPQEQQPHTRASKMSRAATRNSADVSSAAASGSPAPSSASFATDSSCRSSPPAPRPAATSSPLFWRPPIRGGGATEAASFRESGVLPTRQFTVGFETDLHCNRPSCCQKPAFTDFIPRPEPAPQDRALPSGSARGRFVRRGRV